MPMQPVTKMVPDPDNPGQETPGTVMRIVEAEEPFSHARLEDGTFITARLAFTEIVRLNDRIDEQGNPKYQVTHTGSLAIYHPDVRRNGGRDHA